MPSFFSKLFGGGPAGKIIKATQNGNTDKINEMLKDNPELINAKDTKDETPLTYTVRSGNVELVRFLISKGADVNARNWVGDTPLHMAASSGYEEIVKLLLDHGANVNSTGMFGWNPLHCASNDCNLNIMEILIEKGVDINAKNESGITPLHLAVLKKASAVKLLISKGAEVNSKKGNTGTTPLGNLIARGRSALESNEVLKILKEHGASEK